MARRKKLQPHQKPAFIPSRKRIERMKAEFRAANERQSDKEMVKDFLSLGDEDEWDEDEEDDDA